MSLALGMALATTVFTVVDGLFLRPVPFPESNRLIAVETVGLSGKVSQTLPLRDAVVARNSARSVSGVAIFAGESHVLGSSGNARSYEAARVSTDFFKVLSVRPALGELFSTSLDPKSIVISQGIWQTRFGSDPRIIGETTLVDGQPLTIVGVVPAGLEYPRGASIWTFLADDSLRAVADNGLKWYRAAARLKAAVSVPAATAELTNLFARADAEAGVRAHVRAHIQPLGSVISDAARESVQLWIAAAILVVILCAVNFASMMLASGMRRRGELAVRAALGASTQRLAALLVSEAAAIAIVGGLAAGLLALWMLGFERTAFGDSVLSSATGLGWRAFVFGLIGTCLVGSVFALAPAIELARTDLRPLLSGGSAGAGGSPRELRSRRGLVALQLGLALTCVTVVMSVVITEVRALRHGPGFAYQNVLIGRINGSPSAWSEPGLLAVLRGVPGVDEAAVLRNREIAKFWPEGKTANDYSALLWSDVSPRYFAAMGMAPIAGRLPSEQDAVGPLPVMVLPKTVGPLLRYQRESVERVGQRVWLTTPAQKAKDRRTIESPVVGVVEDVHIAGGLWADFAPIYR